jgi:hypothetical protein
MLGFTTDDRIASLAHDIEQCAMQRVSYIFMGMPTWKLVVVTIAWVLASIAIAVVVSIVLTEVLVLVGLVDWGTPEYSWAINGVALVAFIGLVSVPFVFRSRFVEPSAPSDGV